jgi:hypothetical protein
VYLEPLLEELLQLWAGVPAYDCTKDEGSRVFTLRGVLLWTIHDFPGYGTVGGFHIRAMQLVLCVDLS